MDSGVLGVTGERPDGERGVVRKRKLVWRETPSSRTAELNIYFLPPRMRKLSTFHAIPTSFTASTGYSTVQYTPQQDYDATLPFISVQIQWVQQERPLAHWDPHFCERLLQWLSWRRCRQWCRRLGCIPRGTGCKAGGHLDFIIVLTHNQT